MVNSPTRSGAGGGDDAETPTGGGAASTSAAPSDPFDNEDLDAAIWEELERKAMEYSQQQQEAASQSSQHLSPRYTAMAIGETPQDEEEDFDFDAAIEDARRAEMDRILDSFEADALLTQ